MSDTDSGDSDKRLRREIDLIEVRIRIYSEHGLFRRDGDGRANVLAMLGDARDALAREEATAAWRKAIEAEALLHNEIGNRFGWRVWRLHQMPLTAWLLFLFLFLVNWSTGWLPIFPPLAPKIFGISTAGPVLGALGAILRSIWWMHRQIAREQYRLLFFNAHVVSPAIGALLGLFVYLLLDAGLLLVQSGNANPDGAVIAPALAFLAGYNWEWLSAQLDRIFSSRATQQDGTSHQGEDSKKGTTDGKTSGNRNDSSAGNAAASQDKPGGQDAGGLPKDKPAGGNAPTGKQDPKPSKQPTNDDASAGVPAQLEVISNLQPAGMPPDDAGGGSAQS